MSFLKTLEYLGENPVATSMVTFKLLDLLKEQCVPTHRIQPKFLGTRNVAVVPENFKKGSPVHSVIVVHGDKITMVPCGDKVVADCEVRGLKIPKPVRILNSTGQIVAEGTIEEVESEGKKSLRLTTDMKSLNPTNRIVFHNPVRREGNIVYGSGLDNDCGLTIAIHLLQQWGEDCQTLFLFTDGEEGPAAKGHFGIGSRELDIVLRHSGIIEYHTPVVILDGVDAKLEDIDDDGQASIAWEISNGTRGILTPKMAERLLPFVERGLAVWYLGYTSGSDDWALNFPSQFRVGVRGGDWHNQNEGAPFANYNDLAACLGFLKNFIEST